MGNKFLTNKNLETSFSIHATQGIYLQLACGQCNCCSLSVFVAHYSGNWLDYKKLGVDQLMPCALEIMQPKQCTVLYV